MPPTQILTIENATIKYRQQVLFAGLNFEIKKKEHWAIVGESGSGKSALLQILAGRYFISTGKISNYYHDEYIKTHPVSDPLFSYRNLISYVTAKNDLINTNTRDFFYQQRFNAGYSDDTPTVEAFLKKIAKTDKPDKKWTLDKVFETFTLTPLRQKHLIKLSNGESKRLRMGVALLKNPLLLLLDNPLAGLDVNTRNKFEAIFTQIAQSGISIIMVTGPLEIPKVITHVAVLDKNRKLNALKKQEFKPAQWEASSLNILDADKLKQLMHRNEGLHFDVLVSMKNVRIAYGDIVILDNINWEVTQGERWALSGPNGSGKSTLLSLINGDHPQAYANEIVLFNCKRGAGETIWDIKKRIGFMSPELHQYFPYHFTCIQVVESGFYDTIGLFSKSKRENREIAKQWMAIMGLAGVKEFPLSEASPSQQRLCLLARALVKSPYLLLLDEPCIGFDRRQQQKFKYMIDVMAQISNLTIIYVTHHQETLPACITKTLRLE